MLIFGILCPTLHGRSIPSQWPQMTLWSEGKGDGSTVDWQNVRFLSSQTKPHLDYYNMILAITVLIFWLKAFGGHPSIWPTLTYYEFWNFFCVFLFKSFYTCLPNFDNIFPNNIYKFLWGRYHQRRESSSCIRLDNLCFCLLEISLSLSSEGPKNLIFFKIQFFGHSEIYLRLLQFHKMVFCNPQSSQSSTTCLLGVRSLRIRYWW